MTTTVLEKITEMLEKELDKYLPEEQYAIPVIDDTGIIIQIWQWPDEDEAGCDKIVRTWKLIPGRVVARRRDGEWVPSDTWIGGLTPIEVMLTIWGLSLMEENEGR